MIQELSTFNCPRRADSPVDGSDRWREDGHCTYCGSLNSEEFMRRVEIGDVLLRSTGGKNYKVCVINAGGKSFQQAYPPQPDWVMKSISQTEFYFQHLSDGQKERFIQLYNDKKLVFAGAIQDFYVRPFFMDVREGPLSQD